MELDRITYEESIRWGELVQFNSRPSLLLASYTLKTPGAWNLIDRFEVNNMQQFPLLYLSREALELLNLARKQPGELINLAEQWKGYQIGLFPSTHMGFLTLRLHSERADSQQAICVETQGYEMPRTWEEVHGARIDYTWLVQAREEWIARYQTVYRPHMGGIILRLIIQTEEKPSISYGAGIPLGIEPQQLAPDYWHFDLREGFPINGLHYDLHTERFSNICVEIPGESRQPKRIIIVKALCFRN